MRGPNYRAAQGEIEVSENGRRLATLRPEKRFYPASQTTLTEAAIDVGFTRDLYVSLGEPIGDSAAGSFASTSSPSSTGSGAAAC